MIGVGRSINYALTQSGYSPLELDQLTVHVGPPLDHVFKAITGVRSQVELNRFVFKYRERYTEVGYSENVLYPGISEALASLSKAGVPLGICTSKRADFAEKILDNFSLRSLFQFVNGGDIGIRKWHQIEGLLAEGKVTTSSVMVGDRAVDLVAAHRNGLQAAGVLWGHGSRAELENEKPAYLLAVPAELSSLVSANGTTSKP